jgi:hypothetical protein
MDDDLWDEKNSFSVARELVGQSFLRDYLTI